MKQNTRTHKLIKGFHLLVTATLLAGLTLAVAPVPVAHAATTRTITVSNAADGDSGGSSCTLRDAISAANAGATGSFNGCTISSSGSGTPTTYVLNLPSLAYTYTLTGTAGEDGNTTGDLDILASITINGAGQDTTIIDGNQIDRVLHITGTTTVEINAVTIRNGKTPDGTDGTGSADGGDSDHGGGIYNEGALNIANSTLSGNSTDKGGDGGAGGGIYNKGTLNIANSTLSGNSTGKGGDGGSTGGGGDGGDGGSGGGIYNTGGLVKLTNSTVSSNETGDGGLGGEDGGNGGSGGGIYNSGTLTLTNSTVSSNTTGNGGNGSRYQAYGGNGGNGGSGGGIYNIGGALELTNSTVSSNRTGNGGEGRDGGLEGGRGGNGGSGGGICNTSGTVELTNSTVSGNSTGDGSDGGNGGSGGGIHNTGGTVELTNGTVSGNTTGTGGDGGDGSTTDGLDGSGGDGGGIRRDAGTTNLKNTILAGNSAAGSGPDCHGPLNSQDYNLVQDTSDCTIGGTTINDIYGQDPKLDALALNPPGNTETHALLAGSPAVDAIPSTNCTVTTDQRGVDRPQGDECDIGAYEVQRGTIIIEKQTDPNWTPGTFTFSDTIKAPHTFDLIDDAQQLFTGVVSGTYTITETNHAPDFDLTGLSCAEDGIGNSTWDVGTRTATVSVEGGETVTCTFTNTLQTGSVQVCKEVIPDDTGLWDFALTGPTSGTRDDLGDGGCHTFSNLLPGFYTLSETIQSGYATTVDCGAKGSDDDDDIFLSLNAGEHITCTFTNTHHAALVIEKQADAGGCPGTFTFDLPNLAPGTYPVTEDDPAPGFDLTAITCDDGGSATPSTGDVGTRTATFELDPGETVKCTFTNACIPPVVIGGVILPVDKLELLAFRSLGWAQHLLGSGPTGWMAVVTLAALAALTVALVRRRRRA